MGEVGVWAAFFYSRYVALTMRLAGSLPYWLLTSWLSA